MYGLTSQTLKLALHFHVSIICLLSPPAHMLRPTGYPNSENSLITKEIKLDYNGVCQDLAQKGAG